MLKFFNFAPPPHPRPGYHFLAGMGGWGVENLFAYCGRRASIHTQI